MPISPRPVTAQLPQRASWTVRYESLYVLLAGIVLSLAAARLRPFGLAAAGFCDHRPLLRADPFGLRGQQPASRRFLNSLALTAILTVVTTAHIHACARQSAGSGPVRTISAEERGRSLCRYTGGRASCRRGARGHRRLYGYRRVLGTGRRIDPKTLVGLLDTYFSEVNGLIERRGGMVDKVVGDAVHALSNAPEDLENMSMWPLPARAKSAH